MDSRGPRIPAASSHFVLSLPQSRVVYAGERTKCQTPEQLSRQQSVGRPAGDTKPFETIFFDNSYRAYPLATVHTPECGAIFRFSEFDTECEPPDFDVIWEEDGYHSPGICYSGYTAGCSLTWRDVKPGQTAYNCVPMCVLPTP